MAETTSNISNTSERLEIRLIRIIIASNYPLVREALKCSILPQRDMDIIAETHDYEELVFIVSRMRPDLVILDVSLMKNDVKQTQEQIAACSPGTNILLFTLVDEEALFPRNVKEVSGYITIHLSGTAIVHRIRDVIAGKKVIYTHMIGNDRYDRTGRLTSTPGLLTTQEITVLKMVARGLTNKDIGTQLKLSSHTIKGVLSSVFIKLGVTSRTKAVAMGVNRGILNVDDLNE